MNQHETMEQKRIDGAELARMLETLPEVERQKFFWMVKGAQVAAAQVTPKSA